MGQLRSEEYAERKKKADKKRHQNMPWREVKLHGIKSFITLKRLAETTGVSKPTISENVKMLLWNEAQRGKL